MLLNENLSSFSLPILLLCFRCLREAHREFKVLHNRISLSMHPFTFLSIFSVLLVASGAIIIILGWPSCQTRRRLSREADQVSDRYDRLRNRRQDIVFHIDWAASRNDQKDLKALEKQLSEMDHELDQLSLDYKRIRRQMEQIPSVLSTAIRKFHKSETASTSGYAIVKTL